MQAQIQSFFLMSDFFFFLHIVVVQRYSEAEKEIEQTSHSDASSLISLTKNLSLDSQSLKSSI